MHCMIFNIVDEKSAKYTFYFMFDYIIHIYHLFSSWMLILERKLRILLKLWVHFRLLDIWKCIPCGVSIAVEIGACNQNIYQEIVILFLGTHYYVSWFSETSSLPAIYCLRILWIIEMFIYSAVSAELFYTPPPWNILCQLWQSQNLEFVNLAVLHWKCFFYLIYVNFFITLLCCLWGVV